ncbi:hypothetical protein LguiB_034770 [Lonicera macranthoides]
MDARFNNLGFAANPVSNAFKNLSNSIHGSGAGYSADTTLRLDSPGSSISFLSASKGIKRKWGLVDGPMNQQVQLPLCLGLGNSSSSSDSKGSSATACTTTSFAKETDEESSMDLELDFSLHLSSEKTPSPKKPAKSNVKSVDVWPMVDLELSLSTGPAESDITTVHPISSQPRNVANILVPAAGTFPPLQNSPTSATSYFLNEIKAAPVGPARSASILTTPKSSVTSTSEFTQRSTSAKTCQFIGCGKGARGASGLCIAHGGGRRCQKPGCHKGAEGRTAYCKAHGGGRRCEFLGCTKSAEGRTDYCIAHGGGRRCSHEGCTRAARGKSGLCIRHGGGKRCQKDNCTKSAEGLSGLCISHGGGRRCQYPECTKGAQGSTMFCKAHGGGKRCTFEGCTKGAEGSTPFCKGHGGGKRCAYRGGGACPKSVHGGTLFCVAHGGGKRCAVAECTKSARGRTDYCVRHGGGKRCKFEGCSKSAQGSTDFCKAHGGGKRCSWGQPGLELGKGESACNAFARGKTGLCTSHGALVQDKRVHGGATLGVLVDSNPRKPEKMKNVFDAKNNQDMVIDVMNMDNSFGTSAGCTGSVWKHFGVEQSSDEVPEGRVHGGSLIALLAAGSTRSSSKNTIGRPSEPEKYYMMPQNWISVLSTFQCH